MADRPRILIIDDEEVVLDACGEILAGEGVDLATAPDGLSGLGRAAVFQPDLVFVDLKMPGISGFDVLERLRAADPTVVSVVITGYATLGSAVEAMQRGAYDYLPKPFTPEELRVVTRRALEKRRLQEEAARARRERDLLREHFASLVAHELKAPLGAVQQHLMLLAHELAGSLGEAQQERLERLQRRVADLLTLISTWQRAVSTDLEGLRAAFAPVRLPVVVAKAVDSVQVLAARKDIGLRAEIPVSLPPVHGDEGTLVEAVVNLLGNAIKYSHPGSPVVIRGEAAPGTVRITVRDSGVGIPPDELAAIAAGLSGRTAGTAGETGRGLGLMITRRIVEVHGGSLQVESAPGEGSAFTIALPTAQEDVREIRREVATP